jgi:hypothetical protein
MPAARRCRAAQPGVGTRGRGGKWILGWIFLPFFISRDLPPSSHQHSTNQDMIKVSRCCQPCISSNSSIDLVTNDLATLSVSVQSQTIERHHDQLTVRPRSQTQTKSSRQSAIDRDLGKDNHRRRRTSSRHTPLIVPVRVIDNQVHLDPSFISISGSITTIFLAKS